MSKLDDIIHCIGSPWGEGATYERDRLKAMDDEGLERSSHMSSDEEQLMKSDIKELFKELIGEDEETRRTWEYQDELRKKVEEL